MIETPTGVLRVSEIASHSLIGSLILGSNDLIKDLQAQHTIGREPLFYSMGQVVCAARAFGKVALDGVFNDFKDNDGESKKNHLEN
jgi:(3S)-malyl-CoA thioesterase